MIFRSGIFSRRDGLSEQQFNEHWLKVHGALARHMPGVRRYVQNHIQERLYEVQPFPEHDIGGISQQWFDDVAAMERCESSAEYAEVKRDIPNFQGAITILVLEGTPVADQILPPGAVKLLLLARWRGASAGACHPQRLRELAMPLAAGAGPKPLRHVQNLVIDRAHPVSANVPSGRIPLDAMAELWFANRGSLRQWVSSPPGQDYIHAQRALEPLAVYAVDEIRIA